MITTFAQEGSVLPAAEEVELLLAAEEISPVEIDLQARLRHAAGGQPPVLESHVQIGGSPVDKRAAAKPGPLGATEAAVPEEVIDLEVLVAAPGLVEDVVTRMGRRIPLARFLRVPSY